MNPSEVQVLFDLGVKIYTLQGLHAKIYVFDNNVVIGSANISSRSENILTEAALLTSDSKVIRESRAFIAQYATERVEQDYITLCKKQYKPPAFAEPGNRKKKQESIILALLDSEHASQLLFR